MAASHGRRTVIVANTKDISTFCTTSELKRGADKHDLTGYNVDDQVVDGGIRRHGFTAEGWYDTSVTAGPRAVFRPAVGTVIPFIRRPEGTGSGKPQEAFSGLVEDYTETNPVNDFVRWKVTVTPSGPIADTVQ